MERTLYEHPLGQVAGGMNTLTFNVPADTLGFAVLAEPVGAPATFAQLGVSTLISPTNAFIISNYALPPTDWSFAWYGITVAGVPQNDAPAVMPTVAPGIWSVSLGDPTGANTPGEATVWMRRTVDGQFHGGLLDVNVFLANGVTSVPYLTETLIEAYTDYAGLQLGIVTFYPLASQWSVLESMEDMLGALEQTAAATRRPALNILAVADLAGDLEGAAGVAAGIPGQGVSHGTHGSGVVMEVFGDFFDSVIMEHEGGHLAGLFHTSEILPPGRDPLGDTAYCSDVETQFENCPDADNIMFPYGSFEKLRTPMQDRVIRGSTLYRGAWADGYQVEPPLDEPLPPPNGPAPPQPIAVLDLSGQMPTARRPRPAPSQAWAAGLSQGAAAVLSGVWCHGGPAAVDHHGVLQRAGGDDPVQLAAIGADPTAPIQVRKRALAAAGRVQPPPEVVAVLSTIAGSEGSPLQVRVGALRGLQAAGGPELAAVAQGLLRGKDPVLSEVARRVLARRP
ncbi:hypothetical protein [Chondromyces apiculatus]|uniref:hypothetical protein n=1 Tax=Chondromyces apiculatus TaxID=51 RepID=UPI0005C59508|nr:hypothetical protein [Chondromyces apiculatus]